VEDIVAAAQEGVPADFARGVPLSGVAVAAADSIKSVIAKAKDIAADLADDGVINHSNKTGHVANSSPVPEVTDISDSDRSESKSAIHDLAETIKHKTQDAIAKAKDIAADLADDGVINHSNKTGHVANSSPVPEVTDISDSDRSESKSAIHDLAETIKHKTQDAIAKAKDIAADLADDGVINHSNKTGHFAETDGTDSAIRELAHDGSQKIHDEPHGLLEVIKEKAHEAVVATKNMIDDIADDGRLDHSVPIPSLDGDDLTELENLVRRGADKLELFDDIPVAIRLNQTISSLSPLLEKLANSYSGKNRRTVLEAQVELNRLSRQLDTLSAEEMTLIRAALDDQADKFAEIIESQKVEAAERLQQQQDELTRRFEAQLRDLDRKVAQLRTTDLSARIEAEAVELAAALKRKADEYVAEREEFYLTAANQHIAQERGDRLARLDWLLHKVKSLESATLETGGNAHRMYNLNRLWTAVRALDKAAKTGSTSFATELQRVKQYGEQWPLVQTAISSIPTNVANQGVLSESQLTQWWRDSVRTKIKRASLMPEDGGLVSHATSWVLSHFMLDKKGLIPGDDVEAILARSDFYLNRGDLDNAAREVNQLHGWTKTLAHDWLQEARKTLTVRQLVDVRIL